jgi:hypothetical protein
MEIDPVITLFSQNQDVLKELEKNPALEQIKTDLNFLIKNGDYNSDMISRLVGKSDQKETEENRKWLTQQLRMSKPDERIRILAMAREIRNKGKQLKILQVRVRALSQIPETESALMKMTQAAVKKNEAKWRMIFKILICFLIVLFMYRLFNFIYGVIQIQSFEAMEASKELEMTRYITSQLADYQFIPTLMERFIGNLAELSKDAFDKKLEDVKPKALTKAGKIYGINDYNTELHEYVQSMVNEVAFNSPKGPIPDIIRQAIAKQARETIQWKEIIPLPEGVKEMLI